MIFDNYKIVFQANNNYIQLADFIINEDDHRKNNRKNYTDRRRK